MNEGSKTPTWQWIASGAISLLLFFSSVMLGITVEEAEELLSSAI